jgi:chaperonin GroES
MTVAVGDVILFGKYTGSEIVVGEETLLIIRETDVMAVFKAGSF